MVAIFPTQTLPPPMTLGVKSQNSTCSKHCHVAYQIQGNHKGSNMVANSLHLDPTPPHTHRSWGSKVNFFRTMSCCILNYRESRMHQHGSKYFARRSSPTPSRPWGQKVKFQPVQNTVRLHIKSMGIIRSRCGVVDKPLAL